MSNSKTNGDCRTRCPATPRYSDNRPVFPPRLSHTDVWRHFAAGTC